MALTLIFSFTLEGCGSQPEKKQTLADIDKGGQRHAKKATPKDKKTNEDVKKAYYDYIKGAEKDDKLRVRAVTRIAELELDNSSVDTAGGEVSSEEEFDKTVFNTIKLLEETLHDFPNAKGNDHIMYQLAKAHDQLGQADKAVSILSEMVNKYPVTQYFIEAKFRIAEFSFINGNYFKAEDAYTDVLRSLDNDSLYERALFKRGWSRYKQELYAEALDDYYDATANHNFSDYEILSSKDKEVFNEYFRAIGLAYTYMGGAPAIAEYLSTRDENDQFVYETYKSVSDLFLKQERYSDSVATYQAYVAAYPAGEGVIEAGLAILDIWKSAGLFNRFTHSFEDFYTKYHAQSHFWRDSAKNISAVDTKKAVASIRNNLVLLAGYYHNQYNKKQSSKKFDQAQQWYQRYLVDYTSYAKQDQIYPLYADLLNKAGRYSQALGYYELAAYDGDIILDKESAYASIFLTDKLFSKEPEKKWLLDKHINYAFLYGRLYASEVKAAKVIEHAVQMSFTNNRLKKTIELANILPDSASESIAREVGLLKAQAYFNLGQYEDAEVMYQDLLVSRSFSKKERSGLSDKLALSIYRQAEGARETGDVQGAARYFLSVYREVPRSELAATSVYDAIALFMANAMWDEAIDYLNVFKREYPKHPFQTQVSKKLSVAYLKSGRSLEAAREFEKLSDFVAKDTEKMAALWQAAKLYNAKGDSTSALRAYKQYAHTYKRPYAENMEAMSSIATIYQKMGDREKRYFWLRKMVKSDQKAPKSTKTERTRYIAADASYAMALLRFDDFQRIKLANPLEKSLKAKKSAMQDSVKLFGQSAEYGHEEFVTNATYYIGEIYRDFSVALLESERPKGLSDDELEQYDILLEDQAFPFEDKAIEFYETNMERISGGIYDKAIQKSFMQLKDLFPARYERSGKFEMFVEHL